MLLVGGEVITEEEELPTDDGGTAVDEDITEEDVSTPEADNEAAEVEDEVVAGVVSVAVTGQIVVDKATVTVVRIVERAGQLVIVGEQLMIVETKVV